MLKVGSGAELGLDKQKEIKRRHSASLNVWHQAEVDPLGAIPLHTGALGNRGVETKSERKRLMMHKCYWV